MAIKSRLVYVLFVLSLATMVFFTVAGCKGQGQLQWSKHVQIEVFADGSATWVVQQRTVLTTDENEATFWQYLNVTSADDISNTINSMTDYARLITGRSMTSQNLVISANVSTKGLIKEGIIQYQFDWLGFAERIDNGKIKIGDALSGELDLLRDDVLTIKYPSGYSPLFLYPLPDETRESEGTLAWFGLRNFGAGEPNILLQKKSFSWTDVITGNITFLSVTATAVSASLLGYFLGIKRAFLSKESKTSVGQGQASSSGLSLEDEEEKVIRLLMMAGGRMHQSTIAKQCGFSKSKASELLSVMEKKSIVTRRKMGRGKVVALVKKQEA